MRRYSGTIFTFAIVVLPWLSVRAAEGDATSILDKGIKALGGTEKLGKLESFSWKAKGTINFNGEENEFNNEVTAKGLDHYRREFGNDQFKGVSVLAGDKGWRKVNDNFSELDGDTLVNEKRRVYLDVIPVTLLSLKGKDFKTEAGGEGKVGEKPAVILKVTGPEGKDFSIYFDKESGLPVKLTARLMGFQGGENEFEFSYGDYKEFDGIKKATKIEVKRDGETFTKMEVTEFKALDKVGPETFSEPK
jgi:hypothetical protein